MKNCYIILVLFLTCNTLKSQVILNTHVDGAQSGQSSAPEYIRMLPGFQYSAQTTNSFRVYIDANASSTLPAAYNPAIVEPENRNLNTNLAVGSTAGQASVSLSGGATYTIPIFASPGTAGIQPNLSLGYNSQAGNGIAGFGWNIAGLSAITRVPKTIYHDGVVKGVDFNDDRFALDGRRLLSVTGTYGADPSTYYTEVFNGSKIFAHGNQGGAPVWFEVFSKDGTVVQYGNTNDSRFTSQLANQAIICWNINRITDANGNYMDFIYHQGANDCYITEIKYTGNNVGSAPYNSIKFYYCDRTDKSSSYMAGTRIDQNVLLDHIDVVAESQIVKTYKLKYYFDTQSKLNEVEEYGRDGAKYNSTVFGYGTKQETLTFETISRLSLTEVVDIFPGDFNGDGYSDLLAAPYVYIDINGVKKKSHTSFKVYLKDPNPTNNTYVLTNTTALPTGSSIINNKDIPNSHGFIANDVNGDGQDDITIVQTSLQSYGYKLESLNYYISSSNGTIFTLITPPRVPQPNYNRINNGNYILSGDFDGDGISDVLSILGNSFGNYTTLICPGNTTGACSGVSISGISHFDPSTWQDMDNIYIQDFDGDGKSDIMLIKGVNCAILSHDPDPYWTSSFHEIYYSGFPTKYHLLQFGDFNGDGKTDILCRTDPTNIYSPWAIDLFTGNSFVNTPFTFNHTPHTADNEDMLVIADLNSDGLQDIYHEWNYFVNGSASSSKIDLYYSKTGGFDYKQINDPNLLGGGPPVIMDINGDGRIEILDQGYYADPIQVKYFGKENKSNLLERIKNGNNVYTKLAYKRLTEQGSFYTRTAITSYPVNTIQVPFYLVNQMQTEDGIGGFAAVTYSYKDALFHRQGKGFLGFKSVSSVDPAGIVSTNTSTLDGTYYFLKPDYSKSEFPLNTLLNETVSVYTYPFIYQAPPKVYFPLPSTVTSKDYFTGTKTVNETSVDQYGNAISQKTSVYPTFASATPTAFTLTTSANFVNGSSWCPALPSDLITTLQRTGETAFAKSNHLTYDANGNVTQTIDFYGLTNQVTTGFTNFTAAGIPLTTTVSATGLISRANTVEFDPKYRFALKNTDAENYISTATYDPEFGNKLTATDVNGLTSSYTYDGFGSLVKTYQSHRRMGKYCI